MKTVFHLVLFYLFSQVLSAQPLIDDALTLSQRTENLVFRDRVKPNWLPDGKAFWYRSLTGPKTHEYVLIELATGNRRTAPDLKSLGLPEATPIKSSAMNIEMRRTTRTGEESGIKFINQLEEVIKLYWMNQKGEQVSYGSIGAKQEREQHTFDGHVWLVTDHAGSALAVIEAGPGVQNLIIDGKGASPSEKAPKTESGVPSPDGRWSVWTEKEFVLLRNVAADKEVRLPIDFAVKLPFRGKATWSPDSSAFVISSCPDTPVRKVGFIESTPQGQLQPRLRDFVYSKPGDPLPKPVPVVFRITDQGCTWTRIKSELFPTPFTQKDHIDVRWSPDSSEFYFDYNQRGHQLYRIIAVVAKSGDARVLIEESAKTFIDYTSKTWRHWLDQSGELLWMSERDGWCHLYLYDAKTGALKNRVTSGTWPVRKVLHVDEANREVWFKASGLKAGEDPYHEHLCRINLDGSGFQQLTEGDGQHQIEFSPKRDFFIDSWSRADQPPLHELSRSADGALVCGLEKADASALLAAGWTLPELFVAKGRDGKTDIHGILIKPSHFDPMKKYPVIEEIYAGPHSAFVPREFGRLERQHTVAECGFILVQIDGMGTNHRGKAFHDVCWKNLKDAGFPDRIAWMKAAAATRPWLDLSRVGIYGGSAGGQSAMRALLDHHDFYQVAVADCGCHDNRMDKIWWNEQWMGWPIDEGYAKSSNLEDAHKLKGKLLLTVGELDQNVDPASTMQVVGALQRANKSFEFMPLVQSGHGAAETAYGSRLRLEFLIRHLKP